MLDEVIGLTLYGINDDGKLYCRGNVRSGELYSDTYTLNTSYGESLLFGVKEIYDMLNGEVAGDSFFAEKVYSINLVLARESEKARWRERWWAVYLENYKHGCMETIIQDTDSAIARAINGSYSFFKDRGKRMS